MLLWKEKRYCKHGHRWNAYTTYLWWTGRTWQRTCRECLKLRVREWKHEKKARQDES